MRAFQENFPYGSNRGTITPLPPDYVDSRELAANTMVRHDIQAVKALGAKYVSFAASGDFYSRFGTSSVNAAIPTTSPVVDGSAAELNATARRIPDDATHIALIAGATTKLTLSFWS